ncbi:hypothetical protein AB6A40_004557 [Gnathostoma spinigerum]|uniref:Uncharacterized protein n=1 Tax=Gnathostoma spinigerum TaxID=75299 RepID=A0ABD6ELK5_9BILA
MGIKRSFDEMETSSKRSLALSSFDFIKTLVVEKSFSEENLTKFKTLLHDSKDEMSFTESVRKIINDKFITSLLIDYTASRSSKDTLIFDILMLLERAYTVNLWYVIETSLLLPFV